MASAGRRRIDRPREMNFTAKEAMRTPTYWLIVLAVGLRNTVHRTDHGTFAGPSLGPVALR